MWLQQINDNRVNYYSQTIQDADVIKQQRIMIQRLTLDKDSLERKINQLEERLAPTADLLGDMMMID